MSRANSKTERGRFSSRKKTDVVLRVLRGDDLDLVSRETGITAATLSAWREQFVTSGQAALKTRAANGRDDELALLKALVGDLAMRLELSREALQRWRPFGHREVDAMSHTTSPSTHRPYGVVRVCQEWGLSRSTCYEQRTRAEALPGTPVRRGPKTSYTDEVLTGHIRPGACQVFCVTDCG